MNRDLQEMFDSMEDGLEVYLPSKFWKQLNAKNIGQLEATGLQNIKRTVAQNYFTWVVGLRNDQFRHLLKRTGVKGSLDILRSLPRYDPSSGLNRVRFFELYVFTRMLWRLAEASDKLDLLKRISEPEIGNPFPFEHEGRLISQDLANSVLETNAIFEAIPAPDGPFTVCELGAGYGRNAYVFLQAFPRCKYIIVDIPPALYISQEYLSAALPGRKVMRFRHFDAAADVKAEFDAADLVFLLPHQAEQLATKSVDIFINISSLHEMTRQQVEQYFKQIERLTHGYFYTKQWKSFTNPKDQITMSREGYPYPPGWHAVYDRQAAAQPAFFEALYRID